jgi:hypothetical protein
VRVAVGGGRSWPVHVRRRGSSSATRSPTYPGKKLTNQTGQKASPGINEGVHARN